MKGDSTIYPAAIYGTQGIADNLNQPGQGGGHCWKDVLGKFWLYVPAFCDVWKYDLLTNQWTWLKGDSSVKQPLYGMKGISNPNNKPGARSGSVSWGDGVGNLWIFGGARNDMSGNRILLNDLWKYEPSTNQWTWISGDSTGNSLGIYGTQGVEASINKPGGRQAGLCNSSWVDNSGNLWLFGGLGYGFSNTGGDLNDLWKYNPSTNQWTWINGDYTVNKYGIYGTQGITSTSNKPGGRFSSLAWYEGANFFIFGGYGYSSSGIEGWLNDLWKYDLSINQWTWIKGDNSINQYGIYGIQGIANAINKPGSRNIGATWVDNSANLWLFGGSGFANSGYHDLLNDLWKYDPSLNQWTWMKGDSILDKNGVYGTKGISAAINKPGSRQLRGSWKDDSGNFWLFGESGLAASGNHKSGQGIYGSGTGGNLNDLWKLGSLGTCGSGFTWIGVTSTDWTVRSNWCGGVVPGANDDAIVPGGTLFSPIVPNDVTTSVRSLTIQTGATVTLGTNAHLNVMH